MTKQMLRVRTEEPLFDIASYGRKGRSDRAYLSSVHIAQIARTVGRVPEAIVKVLPKGANNFASVRRHLGYIGRYGELELEADDGERLSGKSVGMRLMQDWDLDLDDHRSSSELAATHGRSPPKLVHKLMLSMPQGTPPEGVLAATRNFLREEFALKHRYAFVLHTDQPHPHVHAVVKAVSEDGERLHIRKATLRQWRQEFARHLREQGIPANATERAVRGSTRINKRDGIYRAARRGASTHAEQRIESVGAELAKGGLRIEAGAQKLAATRKAVEHGWRAVSDILAREGQPELAAEVRRHLERMPPARTEKEQIAAEIERARNARIGERVPTR